MALPPGAASARPRERKPASEYEYDVCLTFDAGLKGLELKRPVLALGFRSGQRAGNAILIGKGARPVPSTGALREAIDSIRRSASDQLGMFEAAAAPTGPGSRGSL